MAALDRELDRGGRALSMFDGLWRMTSSLRRRSHRRPRPEGDDETIAA
jgi:hypothetical protein